MSIPKGDFTAKVIERLEIELLTSAGKTLCWIDLGKENNVWIVREVQMGEAAS